MNIVVLIPSLNPDETLLHVVENIRAQGFTKFVIIDDGSRAETQHIFTTLENQGCAITRHAVNLGKGRALKTGFNYILNHMSDAVGVVACDADGQHEPSAIRATADALLAHPDRPILAVRKFFEARVPWRNLAGNTITRIVFYLLTGQRFGDTQCGLRGFPLTLLPKLMEVTGERFEYENVMLLAFRRHSISWVEVPVRALYRPEGQPSHFNKVVDSIRIYRHLLGFAATPAFCGALATLLYYLIVASMAPVFAATIALAVGWLALWLVNRPQRIGLALTIAPLHTAVGALLIWLLTDWLGLPHGSAWWLTALFCVPAGYTAWLHCRFGKQPSRIRSLTESASA